MTSSMTRWLVIGATALGGLLAGVAVDRSLVQLPAWRQTGPVAWAEFTRAADLGRGLIFYPAQGIGALLCSVAAAIAFGLNRASPRRAALPVYGAAALAIAALIVTRHGVVPDMISLRHLGDNAAALEQALNGVQRWWALKASLHALTFGANVWALVALGNRVDERLI